MTTTLYRKYRPTTFSAMEGQEHVLQTLHGALKSGNIGHAYLFSGPRGTGKTTTARLLAKALNCTARNGVEPCNKCFSCTEINAGKSLDLIEIDAASNRGIDEIRNLKESAQVAATSSTFKVFIIDEVHMLTTPAFNALLKTLEEPPAHTLFVLATTEPHKVPETILSRVQRLDFKKLSNDEIRSKLRAIAKAEKLTIDDESLAMLARSSSGSLRDAESSLTKLVAFAGSKIQSQQTSSILGIIPEIMHREFLESLNKRDATAALAHITNLHESGVHLEHFTKQFLDFTRAELVRTLKTQGNPQELVRIMKRMMEARNELRHSPIPQLPLELAVIDLTSHV